MTPAGIEILVPDPVSRQDCNKACVEDVTGVQGAARFLAQLDATARWIDACRAATRKAAGE